MGKYVRTLEEELHVKISRGSKYISEAGHSHHIRRSPWLLARADSR